jgi:predicted  nucleic acid-binding Zn-ribbon protein
MAVEFKGYWSGTFEDYQAGKVTLQMDMPEELAKKFHRILAGIKGYAMVEESEPEDPPAA